jgi:hypothetical protein
MARLQFYLLESKDYDDFCRDFQNRLNDGWLLHGGLFAFPDYVTGQKVESVRYLQAFIRNDASDRLPTGFVIASTPPATSK